MNKRRPKFNTLAVLTLAVLSTALLVWNQFVQPAQPTVTIDDAVYRRGEIIESGDAFVKFTYVDTAIWMDVNTRVKLIDGSDTPTIQIVEGRVVTKGPIQINTREVATTSNDQISYVHYSWLDQIDVAVLGEAIVTTNEQLILNNQALKIGTLPPYTAEPIDFQPEQSTAATFYEYVDGNGQN